MTGLASPSVRGLAVLALLFNAFTWGVSWWPFRQMQALGLHPLWLTALVFAVAVLAISATHRGAWVELLRSPPLWALVLAAGATNVCFNWAVSFGDVVRVVLLFYLMPLWAVLLAWLVLGERISGVGALRVALALAGAVVVLLPAGGGWPRPAGLADGLALLGGFSFALNNVMLRRQAHSGSGARALAMFGGGGGVALGLALALMSAGTVPAPPAPSWQWLLPTLGLAAWFLVANLALQYGVARMPANTASVVMVSEVLFASLSAVALGAGELTLRVALGGGMILTAALLSAMKRD